MIRIAPNALTTVEYLKLWLSITPEDTSYDTFLTLLINYASGWVERITGRSFGLRWRTERVAGSGQQELILKHYPIRILHRITDIETRATIAPALFSFAEQGDIGVIHRDSGWPRRAYATGLVPDYVQNKRYLSVDYTAGYVLPKDVDDDTPEEWILPADLQGIVLQAAAQELAYMDSGADGLSAFSIGDVSWSFDKTPRQNWLDVLAVYKKVV